MPITLEPEISQLQRNELAVLDASYTKPAHERVGDGLKNLVLTGGHRSRAEAQSLTEIAKLYIDHNMSLNGGNRYQGVDERDLSEYRRLYALYHKREFFKFVDGFGNFCCGGAFGRSDALDLVVIIRHVRAANQLVFNDVIRRQQEVARTQRLADDIREINLPQQLADRERNLRNHWVRAPFYVRSIKSNSALDILSKINDQHVFKPSMQAGIERSFPSIEVIDQQFANSMLNYLQTLLVASQEDSEAANHLDQSLSVPKKRLALSKKRKDWLVAVEMQEDLRLQSLRTWIGARAHTLTDQIIGEEVFSQEDVEELQQLDRLMNTVSESTPIRIGEKSISQFLADYDIPYGL